MPETVRVIIAAVFIAGGMFCIAMSILGVFKFKFVMNRMHCAAVLDTMGLSGIGIGLMFLCPNASMIVKLLTVLLIYFVGSPIASHLVGRMEITTDETVPDHMTIEDNTEERTVE